MRFKAWPLSQKLWFFGILVVFWLWGIVFTIRQGAKPYDPTDGTSEILVLHSSKHYVTHGFWEHHLLPTYPPLGEGLDGKPRTQEFVYNHYLAGPDLVLGVWRKIWGEQGLGTARLIPHTLTVLGLGALTGAMSLVWGSPLLACMFLSLLMLARALTVWSTCLYGHSYVTAFYLLTLAGVSWLGTKPGQRHIRVKYFSLGLAAGIAQMFFALDWVPLTFFGVAAFLCLMPIATGRQGIWVLSGLLWGGMLALGYQLAMSAWEAGSWHAMMQDVSSWARVRMDVQTTTAQKVQHSLPAVLREFNRQSYGATGFTAYNLMGLSIAFAVLGLWGRVVTVASFRRKLASIVLAYIAMSIWNILMKSHSMGNLHFIHRHALVLYINSLFLILPIAFTLVSRSGQLGPPKSEV